MKKSALIVLFILGITMASLAALGQSLPGYMDADYYYAGGIQLAQAEGFSETFLWNYLDNPQGIPHPSHIYWMPLASILAAAGMAISQNTGFWAARIPTILLAGLIPVISALQAQTLVNNKKCAWISGMLGVFSGMYIIYVSIPETFVLYLVLGGLICLILLRNDLLQKGRQRLWLWAGILGLLSGLMHLSRADGILWAAGIGMFLLVILLRSAEDNKLRVVIMGLGIYVFTYSLIMGPWYARNLSLFDSLMPPGNSRAIWITDYNQTFFFPPDKVNFSNWWASGIKSHLQAWWLAIKMNIGTLVVVQGMVFLLPLMIAGLWRNRRRPTVMMAAALWALTFLSMTFVFPFAGARGGYLHSGSAVQTLLWASVPAGLEVFVDWGKRKRNWKPEKAIPTFGAILIALSIFITGWFYYQKVYGAGDPTQHWGKNYSVYQTVAEKRDEFSMEPSDLYMVNNPPGFFVATGMSSIVIPGGGIEQALAAADFYKADFLILEEGQSNLSELFDSPNDIGGMRYLGTLAGARIFCFGCE